MRKVLISEKEYEDCGLGEINGIRKIGIDSLDELDFPLKDFFKDAELMTNLSFDKFEVSNYNPDIKYNWFEIRLVNGTPRIVVSLFKYYDDIDNWNSIWNVKKYKDVKID